MNHAFDNLMTTQNWSQYKRKGLSEMRPYTEGEDVSHLKYTHG
jgi:hypothetical protein